MSSHPFTQHLDKNPANHQPLTPLTFLERAAAVFPNHVAVIHGRRRFTYARVLCARPASGLGAGGSTASAAATR